MRIVSTLAPVQLESLWVHGLRRFGGPGPHRLRLDGRLICVIGANEVGKSTLLDALEMSASEVVDEETGDRISVDPGALTRGESVEEKRELVRVRYRLGERDRAVFAGLAGTEQLKGVRWLERCKRANGTLETTLDPSPQRDEKPRHALAKTLREALSHEEWPPEEETAGTAGDQATLGPVVEQLESSLRYIGSGVRSRLTELADWLEEQGWNQKPVDELRKVADLEALPHPEDEAMPALAPRIPQFIAFTEGERSLDDEYDLAAVAADPPAPFRNLSNLASLDLDLLREKIAIGETGTVKDLIDEANSELEKQFAAWTQEPSVRVSFHPVAGTRLAVHVRSGAGASMKIGERSEGLRQFVSLVALTAQQDRSVPPILLIDEVEMHLHYDAQADLIRVLAEQRTASQVVYTTHSAACLPEDLGSAVRVVEGIDDQMASRIRGQFWSDEAGLGTLLMAMGAASLAFVLLRPAAIVEGGADLVLLPSLIREALEADVVGFQVVPGGAIAPDARIAGLDLHGTATIWILDGDESGVKRRRFLVKHGVDPARILLLQTTRGPLELEDLINPATYVRAVNVYAADLNAGELEFAESDLPTSNCARPEAVDAWCTKHGLRSPSKTAIANKVLDLRGEMPLINARRKPTLVKLHADAMKHLSAAQGVRGVPPEP